MERLHEEYKDKVEFFVVYIKEAHPSDGWVAPANERQGISISDPKSYEERVKVAEEACRKMETNIPCLVDGIDNGVNTAYAAWPDRLYVVDKDGRIAVAGGPGPRGFLPAVKAVEAWLGEHAKESA